MDLFELYLEPHCSIFRRHLFKMYPFSVIYYSNSQTIEGLRDNLIIQSVNLQGCCIAAMEGWTYQCHANSDIIHPKNFDDERSCVKLEA